MNEKTAQIRSRIIGTRVRIRGRKDEKPVPYWSGTIVDTSGEYPRSFCIWVACDDGINRIVGWEQAQPM